MLSSGQAKTIAGSSASGSIVTRGVRLVLVSICGYVLYLEYKLDLESLRLVHL